ncbi:OB-fold protein [Fructobacillus tropaeoli]|uniref:OB-fold protein n=1 Tax=Fructobacillus tropaeoli TaxID=709323 RepID=UPI001943745C|nr:hypothetical protein [Fructobacillus tropaeoli]GIC70576.1 hypothetical protein FT12353_12510 [Fructobacillus tropaeoli]
MSKKVFDENGNEIKKPFYKKAIFWIVTVIVLVIAYGSLPSDDSDDSSDSSSSSKTSKTDNSNKNNVIKTTPEEIIATYRSKSSSQADETYKGKLVQVTGKVFDVKGGSLGGYDVTIDAGNAGDDSEDQTLTFNFKDSKKDEALSIHPGSTITVQGKFSNATITDGDDNSSKWVNDVSFDSASLVK